MYGFTAKSSIAWLNVPWIINKIKMLKNRAPFAIPCCIVEVLKKSMIVQRDEPEITQYIFYRAAKHVYQLQFDVRF